jgi:hypothetical protein
VGLGTALRAFSVLPLYVSALDRLLLLLDERRDLTERQLVRL